MPHRLIAVGHSDVGRARKVNEDSLWLHNGQQVWMVADGMGGHVAGQVASQIAVSEMGRFLTETIKQPNFIWPFEPDLTKTVEENALINALKIANIRIYNRGVKEPKFFGMGTTAVVALKSSADELLIATVGDSRCYRYRRGQLLQLTMDDSLLNHLIYKLNVSPEEAKGKVGTNVIVKALGLEIDVEVSMTTSNLIEEDLFIMCSDGLSDLVSDVEISDIIHRYSHDLHGLTHQLISRANDAGGTDNISVICLLAREENTPTMA